METEITKGDKVNYISSANSTIVEPSTEVVYASATTITFGSGPVVNEVIIIEAPNRGWLATEYYVNKYGLTPDKKYLFAGKNELTKI